jgi:hypothetical protein
MGGRKIITISRKDKKEKFTKLLFNLNQSFQAWIKEQVQQDKYADLTEGFQVQSSGLYFLNKY